MWPFPSLPTHASNTFTRFPSPYMNNLSYVSQIHLHNHIQQAFATIPKSPWNILLILSPLY